MMGYYHKPTYIKDLSRWFRKKLTRYERILWERIRGWQILSLRFNRQKPLFAFREYQGFDRFYIADFYCHEKRLIIELDGILHSENTQKEYDEIRNEILINGWYYILRFRNKRIIDDIEGVIQEIESFVNKL